MQVLGLISGFAREEWWRILRTRPRFLLLLAPILAFVCSAWVYSGRVVRELPVAAVDYDHSSLSRSLLRDMDATPQMRLVTFQNEDAVKTALRRGDVRAAVFVPAGSSEAVREGRSAHLVVWRDATNLIASNQLYSACASVAITNMATLEVGRLMLAGVPYNQAKELALLLRADARPEGNPFLDYLRYITPGLLLSFLQMGLMLAAGSLLQHKWEESLHPLLQVLGRSLPWLVVYGAVASLCFAVLFPAWGFPVAHLPLILGLVAWLLVICVAFGAALNKFIPAPVQIAQFLLTFNTPAFVLSGYTFPEWSLPPILDGISRALPLSLFMDAYRCTTGELFTRQWESLFGLSLYLFIPLILLLLPKHKGLAEIRYAPLHLSEFAFAFRDLGLFLLIFAAPIAYLALYGYTYIGKQERNIPIAVTSAFESADSRSLLRQLEIHPRLQAFSMDKTEADQALRQGTVRAIVHLPDDLSLRLQTRRSIQVPVEIPASRFLAVGDIQRAVSEVFNRVSKEWRAQVFMTRGLSPEMSRERAEPLVFEDHPLFNPLETYGDFIIPGIAIMIMHQLLMISLAYVTGTRASKAKTLGELGNFVQRYVGLLLWFSLWLVVAFSFVLPKITNVPGTFHLAEVSVLSILGLSSVAALGIFLGLLLRSGIYVMQLLAFTSYPFFFISSVSWPQENFSSAIDFLGSLLPYRPLAMGLLRNYCRNATFIDLYPIMMHQLALTGLYLFLAFLAYLWTRRNLSRKFAL
ncbi:MAG TPA: ABC transporter permease [Fibrobacteraceae bacterium]|nr:ABC transporter permease [Fibrobacteraceae bacterium]